jgi:hypothetical protein
MCVCVCMYVGQYTIVMVEVTTQEYIYNIFYISTFYNMPPQAEGEGSTRSSSTLSLKRKAVNKEVGSGLVKTLTS